MLHAMAQGASSHGLPLCATSQSSNRSVLPGMGRGITEESITATEKSPSAPRCVSQWGTSKWGTGKWRTRGATILAGDGAKKLTISWTRILSAGPYGEAQCFPAGGRGHDQFVQQASIESILS